MKHSMSAAVVLALGLGLAVSAHAQGVQGNQPMASQELGQQQMMNGAASQTKEVQQRLKADGLYNGRIDGIVGPETRRAVAEFQQQNGLRRTARLDRNTLDRLLGQNQAPNQAMGASETTPNQGAASPPAPNSTSESGSGANPAQMNGSTNAAPNTAPAAPDTTGAGASSSTPPATSGAPGVPPKTGATR